MKNMISCLEDSLLYIKNKHFYLFITIITSFIISTLSILSLFLIDRKFNGALLMFLIPALCILIFSIFGYKLFPKHTKLITILTGIINTLIIIIIQLFFGISTILVCYLMSDVKYEQPFQYSKAKDAIHFPEYITHFPHKIPRDAKETKLYMDRNNWFGSEDIILKFKINKKYIDNELRKYNFISIENYEDKKHQLSIINALDHNIGIKHYTFYIIGDKETENPNEHMFVYFYGIAVYDDNIIYFYINPD